MEYKEYPTKRPVPKKCWPKNGPDRGLYNFKING